MGFLKVGIDIGSTTIKVVVLDEADRVIYQNYTRHFSEIAAALQRTITEIEEYVKNQKFTFALTGSAGMGIAQKAGLPFVQEVIACATAVRRLIPKTDTVVELGGEDAKITYFGRTPEQRMNGVCAGGTGSFIDHMASLLSTDAKGLNELAARGTQLYTIASRCGVFAKTDIQALLNDGVSKEDVSLSILQAVVNQTIGNLAQGRPIAGKVAFLGGPLYFLTVLRERFIKTLQLTDENVVKVDNGCFFVALGAALSEERQLTDFASLATTTQKAVAQRDNSLASSELVLFQNEAEYQAFKERHAKQKVSRQKLEDYHGPLFLGIDAGSTTTKMAVVGKQKELLYTAYESNHGSPLQTVLEELKEFYQALRSDQYIAAVYTTGYGEGLVKAAVHADGSEVETFAHLRAAQEFCPDVSFVLDIGGQDMKCFFVNKGNIGNITLNEACSAGCGSFIQNFAAGLKMETKDFAAEALKSHSPVDLGTRCTVFMNSRVKQAQKEGAAVSDISAGIAISVIKNALFKVMQLKDVRTLGKNIVVQGGTFYNDAVLRAMEKLLNVEVIRPDIAGLMGAYGAAILACESGGTKSALLPSEQLENFTVKTRSYRCNGCGNHCLITVQTFPDGEKYYTGNRCERGIGKEKNPHHIPNVYAFKYERLFNHYVSQPGPKGKIGIPRVLNMYEDYPFWFTFWQCLGYEVVLSDKSSPELYHQGMETIPSDSLCYPAKLVHGHILDLVKKGLKKIFYPCIPFNIVDACNQTDNNYNCPIVASYAENIRDNMDILGTEQIKFLQPFLPINDREHLLKRLKEELCKQENIDYGQLKKAVEAAYVEQAQYKKEIDEYGKAALARIKQEKIPAVLLAGRPYHIDPEINHGIPEMIQSYGLAVLSEDMVYHLPTQHEELHIVNQWSYHARLYHAAEFVAENRDITLIQLSSFGCGLDAITTGQVKEILENHHRIYTMIKLDEVSNLGAARIRVRSLLAALKRQQVVTSEVLHNEDRAHFTLDCKKTHTILVPQLAPMQFSFISTVLGKYGYNVIVPELPKHEDIDFALRYVNNDMCYPAIVVIGQMMAYLRSEKCEPEHTAVMFFQTCGACRATNYLSLMRSALREAGFAQVPVFACYGIKAETDEFTFSRNCFIDIVKGTIYGDLLAKVRNRLLPYEAEKGSVEKLCEKWENLAKEEVLKGNFFKFQRVIKGIVHEFDQLPLREEKRRPRVGIVGEILVKYHPVANNHLEEVIMQEGAEVVLPDLLDFMLYLAYDDIVKHDLLAGKYINKLKAELVIQLLEFFRSPVRKALAASRRFEPPVSFKEIARMASKEVSLGNLAGEGWFLTGEMIELIHSGVNNVVCLQPFGCLPNHITGKGVMHALRKHYPDSNVIALDCDAGVSEVNQLNRIKLMLSVAKEKEKE